MKNIIINGEFKETSITDEKFLSNLFELLRKKTSYFKVEYKNEFNKYEGIEVESTLREKMITWLSNASNLYFHDLILKDFEKTFKGTEIETLLRYCYDKDYNYFLEDIKDKENAIIPFIKNFIIDVFDSYNITTETTFKKTKDIEIQMYPEYIYLSITLLKNEVDVLEEIENLFDDFTQGTGMFTVTSIENKNGELLEIDDILGTKAFDTSAFGNYNGYDEIRCYLEEQTEDSFIIDKLNIKYIPLKTK